MTFKNYLPSSVLQDRNIKNTTFTHIYFKLLYICHAITHHCENRIKRYHFITCKGTPWQIRIKTASTSSEKNASNRSSFQKRQSHHPPIPARKTSRFPNPHRQTLQQTTRQTPTSFNPLFISCPAPSRPRKTNPPTPRIKSTSRAPQRRVQLFFNSAPCPPSVSLELFRNSAATPAPPFDKHHHGGRRGALAKS